MCETKGALSGFRAALLALVCALLACGCEPEPTTVDGPHEQPEVRAEADGPQVDVPDAPQTEAKDATDDTLADGPAASDGSAGDVALPAERCNGLDDNHDGLVDEDWPQLGQPCDGGDDDSCSRGQWLCHPSGTDAECVGDVPLPEICNGIDDDCDEMTDEDLPGCPDYSHDPVLMVHGYWLNGPGTWTALRQRLIDDGWPESFLMAPTFDDVFGCNPEHGQQIAQWVEQLRQQTGRQRIDIVAHSMGALDTRYYIKYLCGYPYVADVVLLAGANHGTFLACLEPQGTCGTGEMCVSQDPTEWDRNDFLRDLAACDETPGDGIPYTSIWSADDGVIVPPESSIVAGARNIQVQTPGIDHAGIFIEDEPYEYLRAALEGAGTNDNIPTDSRPCPTQCEMPASQ